MAEPHPKGLEFGIGDHIVFNPDGNLHHIAADRTAVSRQFRLDFPVRQYYVDS